MQKHSVALSRTNKWRSGFYNIVSAKDRVQDINLYQIKIRVNDTYKKDEKITTKFEPKKPEDVFTKISTYRNI